MSITYSLPSIDENSHTITFYTDTLKFYNDCLAFLLENSASNNYQIGLMKSMVDNPERFTIDRRFLMVVHQKGEIERVVTWFPPQLMVFSFPDEKQLLETRKIVARGVLKMFCSVDYRNLRISNNSDVLSFDQFEEIVKKFDRKLTGFWSTEESLFLCEEYVSNFDPGMNPSPSYKIQVKMMSYSLIRDHLTLPPKETNYELKFLDTTNENLTKHCANMIHRFCKICFPAIVPSEQFILENMLLRPSQKGNTFYVTMKGNSNPIAIALATPIPSACRITHVFTEEEYRGRGIASFLIQSMSMQLFERKEEGGNQLFKWMFLTADSSNPTSNGVYVRSGFKEETEFTLCDINYN
ncbi:GCN5-related N-acetyltransferase [Naegleria gruberi]|uniref:GCN5-related N-acetyltransferase n=1 Tax=Naegleria gruberi TaxID=5762 RepID=D2VW05_NAEGR|nr:GCN5-related N-acetyltransferase [Naegleria gruberi]EFC38995.1 GCN5-related N-acetyltransferase [Naegleria gruberi]|eukprot:XP_002671739.1 GCN5-related N-acetyltransferase [Naegleria gruberi strain NEG-M]